ncbi:hypothetical protein BH09ACT8_BH09ACT8_02260 [soil metagenome]
MTEIDKNKLASDVGALTDFNRHIVEEFRANGGKVGGSFEGGTLLILHTIGAKSGKPRLSPLAYKDIDGKMIIFGSYAGAEINPAWVHNLRADPRAQVEIGTDEYDVVVRELPAEERDAMYAKIIELAPVFADYQAKTTRTIPVFELIRLTPDVAALKAMNVDIIAEFRATGGRISQFPDSEFVLLTTTGASSGKKRMIPLVYFPIDGRTIIAGSFGGAEVDPQWVRNLRADPQVHAEIGTDSYDAVAHELDPAERNGIFEKVVAVAPNFGLYQAKTTRVIPLFELTRA